MTDPLQALIQLVPPHAHGQAGVAEQTGDIGLVLHHEVRFSEIEHLQRAPRVLCSCHQFSLLARAGMFVVRVTHDEDFTCLEPLFERRVEPL